MFDLRFNELGPSLLFYPLFTDDDDDDEGRWKGLHTKAAGLDSRSSSSGKAFEY